MDAAQWIDGRETVGAQGARVKRNLQLPEAESRALGLVVTEALARSPLYFSAALPLRTVPPLFNRYEGGGEYGFHVDGSVQSTQGGWVRTDLSATLFLCEPDSYEGGELIVSDTYGEHEVKLPAGDMILYPSSSLHRVTPVTQGARVCSFFWIQSMVRNDTQRSMLYELDQTITRMRDQGESENTLALTNLYHNLLRMWSEV
jgi:PKHD-type hydroxylase